MLKPKRRPPRAKLANASPGAKAGVFFYGRNRIQMSLAIFRNDVALRINQNLGIVD